MSFANDIPSEDRASTGQFYTTHWSVVLTAGDKAVPEARDALEKLCRTYWYPLYAYVRRRGHDVEVLPPWSLGRVSAVSREDGQIRAGANARAMQGYAVAR